MAMDVDDEIEQLAKMKQSLRNAANEISEVFRWFEENDIHLESEYIHDQLEMLSDDVMNEAIEIGEILDELKQQREATDDNDSDEEE
jgi:hypothetical protein